jgi:hypothetical protein
MNINITALFVCIDDFCKIYEKAQLTKLLPSDKKRNRGSFLCLSEMLFIEILYHFSGFRTFKSFYEYSIKGKYRNLFKELPCYERFVALKKYLFMLMTLLLHFLMGDKTGVYFADSTPIKVCHNKRTSKHKVFNGLATIGKSSMGWFFGFKLHIIINDKGGIVGVRITGGNCDDRVALREMKGELMGRIFADKGYISKGLFADFLKQGLKLITGIRRTMKNYLMPAIDKILLRKRSIVETVFGILKTSFNLEHARHRSVINAFVHLLGTLVAYQFRKSKPTIKNAFITTS